MAGKGKESVEQFLQRRIDVAVRPTLKILYGEAGIGDVPGYGGKEGEYVAPEPEAIGEPTEAQDEGQVLREKFADMALDAAHRFAAGDGNVETFIDELKDMYGEDSGAFADAVSFVDNMGGEADDREIFIDCALVVFGAKFLM